jgi:hypothetical protein
MAYKVLGQVTTTAPTTAATITNYIEDSSFTGYTIRTNIAIPGGSTNSVKAIDSTTPWRWATNGSTSRLTSAGIAGITAPFGAAASAYGFTSGDTNWLTQGWATEQNPGTTANSGSLDKTTAVPVVGGTEYNYGHSYYPKDGTSAITLNISWYSASDSYISQNNISSGSSTANAWRRLSGTVTAPSNAVWAIFHYNASSIEWYIDGVVFGPSSTYASTFTEPYVSSVARAISPYDKTINGYLTDSVFSFSGVTFAGDFVTAYTVPAGKEAVVSTLAITNISGAAATYRVAVIKSGDTLSSENFLFLDVPIAGSTTQAITIGMTLAAGDVVKVAANTAYVNATLFGSES